MLEPQHPQGVQHTVVLSKQLWVDCNVCMCRWTCAQCVHTHRHVFTAHVHVIDTAVCMVMCAWGSVHSGEACVCLTGEP